MRAELRRSIFLACVGLLAGFALVVTLYGAGTLFKQGLGPRPGTPDGPAAPLLAPAEPPPPGEEGAPPPGKPRAALEGRPIPEPDRGSTQARNPAPVEDGTGPGQGKASQDKISQDKTGQDKLSGAETREAPTFDIIRIEPNGEAVIAGRAPPNTTVELLRDNAPMARALVDPSGQFALVPPALPIGSSEITLRVTGADGRVRVSRDSVSVAVSPNRTAKPLIALTSPDKPTIVLSQPDPVTAAAPAGTAKPDAKQAEARRSDTARSDLAKSDTARSDAGRHATNMPGAVGRMPPEGASVAKPANAGAEPAASGKPGPVKIVSVEAEESGRLYVTSKAPPGATVRLYLNDTLVAPGSAGADGRVAFSIGRGVRPGDYRIRVDQVDPVTGAVKTRSEVAFAVPATVAKPGSPATQGSDPSPPAPVARLDAPDHPASPPPAAKGLAAMPPPGPVPAPAEAAAPGAPPAPETAPAARGPASTPTVFVPEIGTATIIRGDSLWQISRRIYGKGTRYTVIYDANQPQIRNPDLIYPGQIFVLPGDGTAAVPQPGSRG